MKRILILLYLLYLTAFPSASALEIKIPNVVILIPAEDDDAFFKPLIDIMQVAADDLKIDLEIVYTSRTMVTLKEKGMEIVNRKKKPDYFVMINDRKVIPTLMRIADEKEITTVLFNGSISDKQYNEFKDGPHPLQHWVGGIYPDEVQAGYLLADTLIKAARKKSLYSQDKKIRIIGLNGSPRSYTTFQREKGLNKYVEEHSDVILTRAVSAFWEKDLARDNVYFLLKSYPEASVIWAASDLMALGAIEGAKKNGRIAGKDILTCGVDWIVESFEYIENQSLSCTVGGHLFDGAWLLVLLLDHFNGLTPNFLYEKTQFSSISIDKLSQLREIMDPTKWQEVNYKKFSKSYGYKHPKQFGSHLILNLKDKIP